MSSPDQIHGPQMVELAPQARAWIREVLDLALADADGTILGGIRLLHADFPDVPLDSLKVILRRAAPEHAHEIERVQMASLSGGSVPTQQRPDGRYQPRFGSSEHVATNLAMLADALAPTSRSCMESLPWADASRRRRQADSTDQSRSNTPTRTTHTSAARPTRTSRTATARRSTSSPRRSRSATSTASGGGDSEPPGEPPAPGPSPAPRRAPEIQTHHRAATQVPPIITNRRRPSPILARDMERVRHALRREDDLLHRLTGPRAAALSWFAAHAESGR